MNRERLYIYLKVRKKGDGFSRSIIYSGFRGVFFQENKLRLLSPIDHHEKENRDFSIDITEVEEFAVHPYTEEVKNALKLIYDNAVFITED